MYTSVYLPCIFTIYTFTLCLQNTSMYLPSIFTGYTSIYLPKLFTVYTSIVTLYASIYLPSILTLYIRIYLPSTYLPSLLTVYTPSLYIDSIYQHIPSQHNHSIYQFTVHVCHIVLSIVALHAREELVVAPSRCRTKSSSSSQSWSSKFSEWRRGLNYPEVHDGAKCETSFSITNGAQFREWSAMRCLFGTRPVSL